MFTDQLSFNNVSDVRVDFVYYANSMENGENFLLEYSTNDGNSWSVAQAWVAGVDFNNNQFLNESVTINANFSNSTRLRIRCDASGNGDQVYIDNVIINICGSAGLVGGSGVAAAVRTETNTLDFSEYNLEEEQQQEALSLREADTPTLTIYPNPVSQESDYQLFINLSDFSSEMVQVALMDINGKQVMRKEIDANHAEVEALDLSELTSGMYILYVKGADDQKAIVEKIILNLN